MRVKTIAGLSALAATVLLATPAAANWTVSCGNTTTYWIWNGWGFTDTGVSCQSVATGPGKGPYRIIIASHGKMPPKARIFLDGLEKGSATVAPKQIAPETGSKAPVPVATIFLSEHDVGPGLEAVFHKVDTHWKILAVKDE